MCHLIAVLDLAKRLSKYPTVGGCVSAICSFILNVELFNFKHNRFLTRCFLLTSIQLPSSSLSLQFLFLFVFSLFLIL